jgi:hypothetical protein
MLMAAAAAGVSTGTGQALGTLIYFVPPITPRPDSGTTSRPDSGTTARPVVGVTPRSPGGTTARPFAGTTARP